MASHPITDSEKPHQPPLSDAPIATDPQLPPSTSVPETTDPTPLPLPKRKLKVPRDEEPPSIYPQQPPTGVRKRARMEPTRNSIPRPHQLRTAPETTDQTFQIPPSLLSQYPSLGHVQQQARQEQQYQMACMINSTPQRQHQLQPQAQPQMQPQMQQQSGTYRTFRQTGSANRRPAADQEPVPPQTWLRNTYAYAQPQQQQQGTYRTFNFGSKEPIPTPQDRHHPPANDSLPVRDRFGAHLPPYSDDYSINDRDLTIPAPLFHQRQNNPRTGAPEPSRPRHASAFVPVPQMESSFAAPEGSDMLENFDFDAWLRGEEEKEGGGGEGGGVTTGKKAEILRHG
ncbi:MAG: hypothetical protein HETSPECPRED_010379 [Heterodermia speciosa]|uniref:Uncharacterized protein n=1 Tax=Heterodermia speciosa TaxID=116794 RepID=A0A8H3IQH2_9LECA|nr:MAG: hypothetical protein HETSPECPRED_010379 [Heterodermia speciosa]